MENNALTPQELLEPVNENEPTFRISRSMGFTVNLQGFESARIDTTIEVRGALKNKDKIIEYVDSELEKQVKKQILEIVEQHDPNKTLLGYPK